MKDLEMSLVKVAHGNDTVPDFAEFEPTPTCQHFKNNFAEDQRGQLQRLQPDTSRD